MAAYLSPIGNEQQSDASGNPLAGGFIYTYIAGTSTLAATFTDATGAIPQANPIVLNASGLPASPIYINGGSSMKFIIQNSASVTQRTIDNIQGINDPAFTGVTTEWINYSGTPTFVSATSFSITGDQTLTFQVNRRVKTQNSGGTIYSTISNAVFGSGVTTVTVINDAGVLDSGLSSVQYALLAATDPSIPETSMGRSLRTAANASTAFATTRIDVASATTVNLTSLAPSTQHINITGTTTITGFTVAAGAYYFARFNAALTLTNGASLVTQTGANITTAAGDTCIIRATAANTVEVLFYSPAGLRPSNATPLPSGTGTAGTALPYAREDHVHAKQNVLGDGQTWQVVTGSRALGTTYTNSTGRPIQIAISIRATVANSTATLTISGAVVASYSISAGDGLFCFVVPDGATYATNTGNLSLTSWAELR